MGYPDPDMSTVSGTSAIPKRRGVTKGVMVKKFVILGTLRAEEGCSLNHLIVSPRAHPNKGPIPIRVSVCFSKHDVCGSDMVPEACAKASTAICPCQGPWAIGAGR